MIIAKAPLRVCFFSGGSDMRAFYMHETGAALSCTINKYVNVVVNPTPNANLRMMHDITQDVEDVEELQNKIARECFKFYGIESQVTVASLADVRSYGAGLGSSSAFTVGMLSALSSLTGQYSSPDDLAEHACEVEIGKCGSPIGKQDQYACAHGGFNLFEFHADETVIIHQSSTLNDAAHFLNQWQLLIHTGSTRSANDILARQSAEMSDSSDRFQAVRRNRDRAYEGMQLIENGDFVGFGHLLEYAWAEKKNTVSGMSNSAIDSIHDAVMKAGALGCKLLGAGGGGFMLAHFPPDKREAIREAVPTCATYDFQYTDQGCQVYEI